MRARMAALPHEDLLVDLVLDQMPDDVLASMTEKQLKAVRLAVSKASPRARHAIDFRFVLPLVFTQMYFVFMCGRDRRYKTENVMDERRAGAGASVTAWGMVGIILFGLVVLFAIMYAVKCVAGIDLFPGHLHDYLPFLKNL